MVAALQGSLGTKNSHFYDFKLVVDCWGYGLSAGLSWGRGIRIVNCGANLVWVGEL